MAIRCFNLVALCVLFAQCRNVLATTYLNLGVYVGTNSSDTVDCDSNNMANVMMATEYCTYDKTTGISSKVKNDCNTIEYYSNTDCSGTPSSEGYLDLYDPDNTCFNYNIQDDDSLDGLAISYSITCIEDPEYLTWPGYVLFSGNDTQADTCSNSVSSLNTKIFALNNECTGLTLTESGYHVSMSGQAMIVDDQLVERYYYMNSVCDGDGIDEIIIYEIGTCEDTNNVYSSNLKFEQSKHASILKNSVVSKISSTVLRSSNAVKGSNFETVGDQLFYPDGFVYGSSQVGLIPYVEHVIAETGGINPATSGTGNGNSGASTLGAGAVIGIIFSIMAVATVVAYIFYSRRKSTKAAGQLGMALQEVK